MSSMNTQDLLVRLQALKPIVATRYKTKEMGLFGSFVRGEQRADSDVDLLVDFEDEADLFDLVGLAQYLERELKCKVDVVPKRALRAELCGSVLQEVITV